MSFRVDVDTRDADRALRVLTAALTDLRGFWPLVVPLVTGWWRRQFDTQGGFAGQRWQPLSPAYAAWKARRYPGRGILVATGQAKAAASRPRRTQTPTSLTLTIDDAGPRHGPVLQYHQTGDGVPRRPLVFGSPLPPIAQQELDRAAERYILDITRRL